MPFEADAVHLLLAALALSAIVYGLGQRCGYRRTLDSLNNDQHLQEELRHKERLASIGRLAAGVAHEIGNPVTGIACLAQNLRDGATSAEIVSSTEVMASADQIIKQTQRIDRIVSSLVQFSHSGGLSEPVACTACNVADCVDEAIHLLSLDRNASSEQFSNTCDRELLVFADNQLLLQVFVNLLDNARWATPAGEQVVVTADRIGGQIHLHVDNPKLPDFCFGATAD